MAKMIPENQERQAPWGEHRLYEVLRDALPSDFTVFHSLPFVSVEEGSGIFEHEIDFLVIHRELGFLDIEVKGGREIKYLQKQKKWISVSHKGEEYVLNKDPYLQASDNIHWLAREIVGKGILGSEGERFPFTHGYAVAFPDTNVETKYFPPHARKELTLDGSDLASAYSRVVDIMQLWQREGTSRPITEREYNDLCSKFLMPEFRLTYSVGSRIEDEEVEIYRLTEEQCYLLDQLRNYKRALIQGYAGTGKTQMAMEKAHRLAADEKTVLLLCFNNPLARHLEALIGNQGITVDNYHNFCHRMAEEAGLPFEVPPSKEKEEIKDFWEREVPALLVKALDVLDKRYDAVIIDEGQDFHKEWFEGILKLMKDEDESSLYIFFDERQNIYKGELQFPIDMEPLVLSRNCRNTQRICNLAAEIGDIDLESYLYEMNPEGERVHFKSYRDPVEQMEFIKDIVSKLVKKDVNPGQIMILSPHVQSKSCLAGVERLAGLQICDYQEPMPQGVIGFSTAKRFKGLESDVVIFCDMDGRFPINDPSDQYVAVTRAKHLLYVLHDMGWKPPAI